MVFNPGDLGVKVGMSADASIRVERRENVIQVPNRALKSQGPYKTVQVLYGQGKLEHGKFTAPPAASEALTKYLELDPNGPHANDAREMLQKIGADVETTYKTRKN